MESRYTATVYSNQTTINTRLGSDFFEIRAVLLVLLEESNAGTLGVIVDNHSKSVVQEFRKAVIF